MKIRQNRLKTFGSFIRAVVPLLMLALCLSCSSGMDRKKFEPALKAAKAVQKSIDNLDDYEKFGRIFDAFANEVIELRGKVATDRERELLEKYSELLVTYQDGYQLWEYKVESSQYPWIPEGRLYLEPRIKALSLKYNLPVESHRVELTGHAWKSVPAASLNIIWERARVQLSGI